MKKQTIPQRILLFMLCIALSLNNGITLAAAEDDWIPCTIGFYYSTDAADTNMLKPVTLKDETGNPYEESVFHAYDDNNVFYMYLDAGSADSIELLSIENEPSGDDEKWWGEAKALNINPWTKDSMMKSIDEDNPYITVKAVDSRDGWYQITVKEEVKSSFGLGLEIRTVGTDNYTNDEGENLSDSWVDGKFVTILYHESRLALVNEDDPCDFNTYLNGNPGMPVEFQLQQLNVKNGKVTVDKVTSLDDLELLAASREDDWAEGKEHIEKAAPDTYTLTAANGTFSFTSKVEGKYYLVPKGSYTVEDVAPDEPTALPENPLQIDIWLPDFSFHSAPEVTVDTWLGNETTYKEPQTATMYVMPYLDENEPWAINPDTISFAAYNNDNEKLSGYITTAADTNDPNIYRITITDKASGDFTIKVTARHNGYGSQEDPNLSETLANTIRVNSSLTGIRIKTAPDKITYTEGEAFDKAGIVVEAVYSDNSTYTVTDYTINAPAKFAATDTEVNISWHGKTVKQAVTVNAKTPEPQPQPQPPVTPQPPATPEPEVKVGDTCVYDGNTYVVTAADSDKKEVAYKSGDENAEKVTIPSSITINGTSYKVTEIAANSFSGNKKITSVTIPDSVVKIGNNAFKNCTNLTMVKIPKNVTAIGKNAFSGCKKVKTFTISSTKIKTIGKNAFNNISSKATIKVPKSKKKAYTKLLKKAGFKGKVK